jgi:hypothetical protein
MWFLGVFPCLNLTGFVPQEDAKLGGEMIIDIRSRFAPVPTVGIFSHLYFVGKKIGCMVSALGDDAFRNVEAFCRCFVPVLFAVHIISPAIRTQRTVFPVFFSPFMVDK